MQPHDWLWVLSLGVGLVNAWQNVKIENAVLRLRGELTERIAKVEGQVQAQAQQAGSPRSRR